MQVNNGVSNVNAEEKCRLLLRIKATSLKHISHFTGTLHLAGNGITILSPVVSVTKHVS